MTFLPNGAAEEEENDSDEHEEEDEEEISIHGDVAVYLYQVLLYDNDTDVWRVCQAYDYSYILLLVMYIILFVFWCNFTSIM